ncbi:MAG TPA: O-antigen ligase family protein [Anaerolineales bacterium]|nr:O-antigen ligase family protein [Anaerolineales bacterium]
MGNRLGRQMELRRLQGAVVNSSRLLPGPGTLAAQFSRAAWILFLISLPVTSFPFFPSSFGGGTLVRPLAVYPMLVLLAVAILPRFLLRPLPRTLVAFSPFVLVALASTLLASLQGIEASQGISVADRTLRALATLGVGGAIYLTVALYPQTLEELRHSLRWLYAGFALALLWGSLQAIYVLRFSPTWFDLLGRFQEYISIRRLFFNRISGLTYEPNWFAEQVAMILLPWLLASVLTGKSAFNWRWRRLTLEWLLLAWAVAVLPFTYSRAGLFILLALVLFSVLFFRQKRQAGQDSNRLERRFPLRRLVEGGVLIALLAGGIYLAGGKNPFFARIWEYWERRPDEGLAQYLAGYFEYLGFGARFTYWETGYRIYATHPALGVGLGNYAFYFDENLPERPLAVMPEVLRLVVPEEGRNRLVTSKNLYIRVLAETGLVGAAAFLAFLMAVLGCALFLWMSPTPDTRFCGVGSLLGMIAFALAAFSFDSFALPNMWVTFGLVTSAAYLYGRSPNR